VNEKISVVDQNPEFRHLLARPLRKMGYEPIGIRNGEETIARAPREHPIHISIDIPLPGMDGTETAAAIKQNPDTAEIPVVALSTYASKDWQQKAFDAGIRTYLTKSSPPQTIKETIKLIMARESASREHYDARLLSQPGAL